MQSTPLELAREVLRQGEAAEILDDFDKLRKDLFGQISNLKNKLEAEDPTIADLLEGASRKIQYQIDKVSRRFVLNHHGHETHRVRHLSHLGDHLLPRNRLQERVVNLNSFLVKEGHRLVDEILERIDPENLSHQILYL
jgi:DNA repair exonuclease SbcCD ATPase subunit